MIDLYVFAIPNCQKISIALEELGLAHEVMRIDIRKNEQTARWSGRADLRITRRQEGPDAR